MARFSSALNKHVRGNDEVPVASASRAASGNTGWLNSEDFHTLNLLQDITVFAMTTLDMIVETAQDSVGTNPRTVGSFTQKSGVSSERKSFAGLDKYYRISWTKTGGTSATFSVSGESK